MEETITSRRNPLLAHTKKLLTSRAYREKSGEFAADGVKLLRDQREQHHVHTDMHRRSGFSSLIHFFTKSFPLA